LNERDRGRVTAGIILMLLGLGLFGVQFIKGLGAEVILFVLGGMFIIGYLYTRIYALLIPGCILVGIGLGTLGGETIFDVSGNFTTLGLGVGFVAIYVIDLIYRRNSHWWPLVPGLILIFTGLVTINANLQRLLSRGWPLVLVFLGLMILVGAFGLPGKPRKKPASPEIEEEAPGE
jgi:hypothetical protein